MLERVVDLEIKDPLDQWDPLDLRVMVALDPPVLRALRDPRELRGPLELRDLPVPRALRVTQEPLEPRELKDLRAPRVVQEPLELKVTRDLRVPRVLPDRRRQLQVLLDLRVLAVEVELGLLD
jgi:hypothetical protein